MFRAFGVRVTTAMLVATAGLMVLSPPAGAIQTTTWGLEPGPASGGPRPSLSYPSNGQTVHDSVIVYNRTGQPQTVTLSVLGATRADGTYQYTIARRGLAGGVSLSAGHIVLPPHEQARVPLTVKLPRHSKVTTLAAIAAEGAPVKQGSLLVQQRLVLLVEATPSTSAPLVPDIGLWGPVAGALVAVVGGLALREVRRRRRTVAVEATEPSTAGEVEPRMAGVR